MEKCYDRYINLLTVTGIKGYFAFTFRFPLVQSRVGRLLVLVVEDEQWPWTSGEHVHLLWKAVMVLSEYYRHMILLSVVGLFMLWCFCYLIHSTWSISVFYRSERDLSLNFGHLCIFINWFIYLFPHSNRRILGSASCEAATDFIQHTMPSNPESS